MDPFLSPAAKLKRKGLHTLTLIAGVLLGFFIYQQITLLWQRPQSEPRAITTRGELTVEEKTNIEIFEETAPAVVFITAKRRQWFLYSRSTRDTPQGTGSGFIWDDRGHIVTNFHVLQGGDRFEVVLQDQSSYDAVVVGVHPPKDLAVLRIDAPKERLKPIPVGTNKDLKVGQKVLAIGNPFGLDHTLTTGVVSALDRTLDTFNNRQIEGAIQTDAAINPGNSGGPLLDSAGRLIGVNTQIFTTTGAYAGIGFAIPVDAVNQVVPQLIQFGKVIRPGLGIYLPRNNAQIMRYLRMEGVMIRALQERGSAERAGLQGIRFTRDGNAILGDIIVAIDDEKVTSEANLANILDRYQVGDTVKVTFVRDGRNRTTNIVLQAIE